MKPNALKPLTLGRACHSEWPQPEYILGPLQPGDVGLLSGADGLGKSWVALAAGLSVATGRSIAGGLWDVPEGVCGPVIYFAVEDREADHGRRIQAVIKHCRLHDELDAIEEDDDRLTLLPMLGQRVPLVQPAEHGYQVTTQGAWWEEFIQDYRLVILDPLRAFHDLVESDGAGMDFLVRWLVSVAMRNQQAILLVHHASQGAILDGREDHHAGRGATDLPAGCRGVWTLRGASEIKDESGERWRVLVNGKASHGAEADKRYARRGAGGVLYRAEPPSDPEDDSPTGGKAARPTRRRAPARSRLPAETSQVAATKGGSDDWQ